MRHGGNIEKIKRQEGLSDVPLIDFSANINPLGLPNMFRYIISHHLESLEHYPDYEYLALKEALAEHYQLDSTWITVGNGAEETIHNYCASQSRKIVIIEPTFSAYRLAAEKAQSQIFSYVLKAENDFQLDTAAFTAWLDRQSLQGATVFLCRPNNPTAVLYSYEDMVDLVDELNKRRIRLVLDESFIEFTEEESLFPVLSDYPNLLILRSLTKFYAMPGLRLGFASSSDQNLIHALEEYRNDWNINSFADLCGREIPKIGDYRQKSLDFIKKERERVCQRIEQIEKIRLVHCAANFYLIQTDIPDFYRRMLDRGILIRTCENFIGMEGGYFRLAVRTKEENDLLLATMEEVARWKS